MITFRQASQELEQARIIIYRIRIRCPKATWFHMSCRAIESLIKGLKEAMDYVEKTTNK